MKTTQSEFEKLLSEVGLELAESFHDNGKYRQDEWLLTRCKRCGTEAHYRLKYILDTHKKSDKVCRACYWLDWYGWSNGLHDSSINQLLASGFDEEELAEQGITTNEKDLRWSIAEASTNEHGYDLINLIRGPRAGNEVLVVKCQSCGRQSAIRAGDEKYPCSCGGKLTRSGGVAFGSESKAVDRPETEVASEFYQDGDLRLFCESDSPAISWWDHDVNDEEYFHICTCKARKRVAWTCPDCQTKFFAPLYAMYKTPFCPTCLQAHILKFEIDWDELSWLTVFDVPDLLAAWDDPEWDPRYISLAHYYPCHFRCPEGHRPKQTPYSFLKDGCMVCRGLASKMAPDQEYLDTTNPELAAEWLVARDGEKHTPENVKSGSKRTVTWKCIACGHTWDATVRDREKRENNRCPACGKVMGSLAWKYPQLAAEWSEENPLSPWNTKPFGKLEFKPKWKCSKDPSHTWSATTSTRINKGKGCPFCDED